MVLIKFYNSMVQICSLFGFLTSSSTTRLYRTGPKIERLTILRVATHETELGDHDFCLSRPHYTDTDPTSGERAATAGNEPGTSSPGVARSTDWATAPLYQTENESKNPNNDTERQCVIVLVTINLFLCRTY